MIGIFKTSLPNGADLSASSSIAAVAALGLDAIMFGSLFDIDPTLDAGALAAAANIGTESGVRLAAGAGWINPCRPDRTERVAALADGVFEAGFAQIVAAAARIGMRDLFFVVGTIADRESSKHPWSEQLTAVAHLITRLRPVLVDHGVRLLVKTHEEITTFEVARLVDQVGPDILGVALDPVNLLCRIEEPTSGAKRVAKYIAQVHLDDAVMRFDEGGLRRYLCPLGEGIIEWDAILKQSPDSMRWIELHRGQFSMPVFDLDWIAAQPDLTLEEYVSVIATAPRSGNQSVPWDQRDATSRLDATIRRSREFAS